MSASIKLVNAIGISLAVSLESVNEAVPVMRKYGLQGWASGDPPDGGFILPFCMADTFDWALIGARSFVIPANGNLEETKAVERLGLIWKYRYFAKSKYGPEKIVYSRGARGTAGERDEAKDQKDDYIWLIQFVGGGRSITACEVPKKREEPKPDAPAETVEANTTPNSITPKQHARVKELWDKTHFGVRDKAFPEARSAATKRSVRYTEYSEAEAALFITNLETLIAKYELERTS